MAQIEMSEAAREARRAYMRKWRAANKDKQREYARRHWEKKQQSKNKIKGLRLERGPFGWKSNEK